LIPVESDVSSVAQVGFDPKSETHVTIIGFPNGRKVMRAVKQNPEIEQAINRLIARSDFRFTPTGRAFEIEKEYAAYRDRNTGEVITPGHTRQALIEEVEMPGLARFYGELSELIGEELAVPYPHISLGTRLDPRGIGINSVAEFEALNPKPVTLPQNITYVEQRVTRIDEGKAAEQKVVTNEDGSPKTFYHGTDAAFEEFTPTEGVRTILAAQIPVLFLPHRFLLLPLHFSSQRTKL
jgi:hypothetical protein